MKKLCLVLLLCLLLPGALAEESETQILLGETIMVDGMPITEAAHPGVQLAYQTELHDDVPNNLQGLKNRVVTITSGGAYRISGTAADAQIAVRAEETDQVRLILDGVDIACRTAPAIVVYSAHDPRTPGAYGVTIELADGSENVVTGSHTVRIQDDDIKLDGAICSLVSLGFEGGGSLTVDADNEGVEVKYGHMTINGGDITIQSGDDPLNVSEDNVGVLTMNDGYVYSSVRNTAGGEGDGIDSNGQIIFNGGTAINLAHPTSQDGGIDSDGGSYINGGVIVGAGNMYDPIETDSAQLFMMLQFAESTNELVVVTDRQGNPVFAYDFPHDYTYIAFSTPELREGETYHVYLGGEIEGVERNGLYTQISSYVPGRQMTHGDGTAQQGMMQPPTDIPGMQGGNPAFGQNRGEPLMGGAMQGNGWGDWQQAQAALAALDLNDVLKDADLNELLRDVDLNDLLTGVSITDLLTEEQLTAYFGNMAPEMIDMALQMGNGMNRMGNMGGMRGMEASADGATADFRLTRETTGFTNVAAMSVNEAERK